MKQPEMPPSVVRQLYIALAQAAFEVVIDGGWGIDALLGKQTRTHRDLDIAVPRGKLKALSQFLAKAGYTKVPRDDSTEYMFVVADENGHQIDVHSYDFDADGNNIWGIPYPRESLTGNGVIDNEPVRCIALDYVLRFHAHYEPDDEDRADMAALCTTFGVEPPPNY